MRTTSMVMGIIGGAVAILFGVIFIVLSSTLFGLTSLTDSGFDSFSASAFESIISTEVTLFTVFGICTIAAGVIGLVGGLIVKRKNIAGGVLLIIAAVLSLCNMISMVLFILGGVFALKQERQDPVYYPAPPYYAYPPYPPYPQPPVPPQNPPIQNPPGQQ